jgi:RND family efflux transporter MFP subunit
MNIRTLPVIALAPIAAIVFTTACGHDEPHSTGTGLEVLKVEVIEVSRVTGSKPIDVRGTVQAARQAEVSSRVMGPVVALKVRAGAKVAKGQTLLEIQPETSQGQLAQAQGALAQANAALSLAERNYQRYEALHAEKAASDLELDMAKMQFEQSSGAVTQAEGAVRAASSVAKESIVRAPFAAQVMETMVEVGDLAAPGRPLVRLESLADQQLWLTVREADNHRVEIGQKIETQFDSRPEIGVVTGSVVEIVPSADPATHTFTVKVALEGLDVRSGLSGRALLPGDPTEYLAVPISAVHRRGGLELVVVRATDGTARTLAVTTGQTLAGGRVEVLSGLEAGSKVVVNAPGPVADGTPLDISS